MKKFLIYVILVLSVQNISFSMTQDKLYRLMLKANNETAFYAIENYCAHEDPGLEVDSISAEILHYSKSCKCAVKAGKTENDLIAEDILEYCGL